MKHKSFELLIFDYSYCNKQKIIDFILLKHNFTQRFQVLSRVLKSPSKAINNLIPKNNKHLKSNLDKILLDNFTKISQPSSHIKKYEPTSPIEIKFDKYSIYYLKLYI